MRKWGMALWTVLALSIGIAWAEGTNGKKNAECKVDGKTTVECKDGATCCCCAKSCPK